MAAEDAAIYELHVRDFSAMDKTVNAKWKGKYLAFEQVHRDLRMAAVCKDSPCTDGFMLNFAEKIPGLKTDSKIIQNIHMYHLGLS